MCFYRYAAVQKSEVWIDMGKRGMDKISVGDFVLFPAAFLYYELLFKWFGGLGPGNVPALLFLVPAAGGLAQAVYLLLPGRKSRFYYAAAVLGGTAVVFLVEYFTGRAFQTFMTLDSILAGAGDAAVGFGGTIGKTVVRGWYVVALFLLPVIFLCLWKKRFVFNGKPQSHAAVAALLAAVFCFFQGNSVAVQNPVYQENYQFDLAARKFGLLTAFRLETAHMLSGAEEETMFVTADTAVLGEAVSGGEAVCDGEEASERDVTSVGETAAGKNAYTGIFKGKNLIMICAEAFSPYAVSRELMPALYRMMHQGFYFSDYYQPAWGGSTSTGEYSMLLGLIPVDGVKSIRETVGHDLPLTIGNQLSRQGYYSAAYHNNSYTYYSRDKTHPNFGYSVFMGMGNGMEEGVTDSWPQSDLEMIDFTVPQYIGQQPFNIYYMTVSGHCGYSFTGNAMSRKNRDAVQQLNAPDTVKAYIASQLELEYAMESLISQLESAGILDDTVICLTADHYPYGLEKGDTWGNDRNYLPELYGCEESDIDKFVQDKNAWILWSGCLEEGGALADLACEIREPTYSLDILPTLSNLFGVEYDSRLLVGRDVFSDEQPLVIWPDYSWKTDRASYNAVNGKITGEVSQDYVNTVKTNVKNKFSLSRVMLDSDSWGGKSQGAE